ncbi:MAG TPA: hypothetical protein PKA88_11110 [Polyangiaceae bacterium]|nr:hypothetical protein [Polyangiaceae bacterium]HMR75429.1 hypothetical protein [Polyangiaceae bacterium]
MLNFYYQDCQTTLMAGRALEPFDIDADRLDRLIALTNDFPEANPLKLVAVPVADMTKAGPKHCALVVGRLLMTVSAQNGPMGNVSRDDIAAAVKHADGIPDSFWTQAGDILGRPLDGPNRCYVTGTGPSWSGGLGFGVVQKRAVKGLPFFIGRAQGAIDPDNQAQPIAVQSGAPHPEGLAGWLELVSERERPFAEVDLSDTAQAAREALTRDLTGPCRFFLLSSCGAPSYTA